ncbi:MAG: UrcA family protein [Parvularculaceae bacterium]|nr:UrcA family protein [Parvularculaceae bacterium]
MKTLAIVSTVLAIAATPCFAGDVSFSYNRSDLASSARVAALYERIGKKADAACGIYQNSRLFAVAYEESCVAAVTSEIVAGIDNDRLTSLHETQVHNRVAANR